jgi:hypothetical protein
MNLKSRVYKEEKKRGERETENGNTKEEKRYWNGEKTKGEETEKENPEIERKEREKGKRERKERREEIG